MGEIDDPRNLFYAVLYTYYEFGISNPEHYHLMSQKQWNKKSIPIFIFQPFKLYENHRKMFQKAQEQTHILVHLPDN